MEKLQCFPRNTSLWNEMCILNNDRPIKNLENEAEKKSSNNMLIYIMNPTRSWREVPDKDIGPWCL